jgi:hypothetical protein
VIEWLVAERKTKKNVMKTIKKEEYAKLSRALYNLEDLLECMGVKEFTLSHDKRDMQIDTDADNIDTELLYSFCSNIEQIHEAKFGNGARH